MTMQDPGTDRSSERSGRVLVVDDDAGVSGTVAAILEQDGHVVDSAANGAIALAKVAEAEYDVIVSDVLMPVLDGPGLYRELERRKPDLLTRMVFITGGRLSAETYALLTKTGAPILSKPFDIAQLRLTVKQTLAQAR